MLDVELKIQGWYWWLRILRAFQCVFFGLTGLRQLWEQRPEGLRILFGGNLHSDRRGSQTAPQPTLKQQGEQDVLEAVGQIQLFIFQRPSRNTFTFYFSFFFPPQAEAVESIHQACPVWLQWQRAPIRGPIGGPVASHQTSTELQLSAPDTENSLELASTQPTPVHRSKLTLTHTVCLHSHIRVHTALIHFPIFFFCKMAVVKNRRDVRLLPIVSDDQSHPDSVEHLHTPPSH